MPTMNEYQPLFFDEPEEETPQPDGPVPGPAATVVFSEAPGGPFDYLVPPELQESLSPGQRVRVPLGRGNRLVTGYCVQVGEPDPESPWDLKPIDSLIDDRPLLSARMLELTRWMATTLAPSVRVNAIAPGGLRRKQPRSFQRKYVERTPLGRMAVEEDIMGAVAYLVSDLSSYVTGQVIGVNGGLYT